MGRRWWILGLILMTAAPAAAHPVGRGAPYVVRVEDTAGRALRTFHRGRETYVLGNYGDRYNIRVSNQSSKRIEAVVTVDGRDVITGKQGDYRRERGYVVPPYGDVLIEGFRTSEASVAAFRFTNPGNSYSARMGTPQHVGVVGVAVFREQRPYRRRPAPVVPLPEPRRRSRRHAPHDRHGLLEGRLGAGANAEASAEASAAPAPEASADAADDRAMARDSAHTGPRRESRRRSKGNLGTEYGEHTESHVVSTRFTRQSPNHPNQLIVLRYDNAEGLRARGFHLGPPPARAYAEPSPFPRNRFAPPPP